MAPREIADSDDEDELEGAAPVPSPIPEQQQLQLSHEIDPPRLPMPEDEINFDQFLSQSQSYNGIDNSQSRHHDQSQQNVLMASPTQPFSTFADTFEDNTRPTEDNGPARSTGSTDRVRRDIVQMQGIFSEQHDSAKFTGSLAQLDGTTEVGAPSAAKLKRARTTDFEDLSQRSDRSDSHRKKAKRTYTDRNRLTSSAWALESSISLINKSPKPNREDASAFVDPSRIPIERSPPHEITSVSGRGIHDGVAANTLLANATYSAHDTSTVRAIRSSVGGYESITITDPNFNPFATEASATESAEQANKIAEIFKSFHGTSSTEPFPSLPGSSSAPGEVPTQGEQMGTATEDVVTGDAFDSGEKVVPRESMDVPLHPSPVQKRKRQRSTASLADHPTSAAEEISIDDARSKATRISEIITEPKKRGRKPKAKIILSDDEDDVLHGDAIHAQDLADSSPTKNPSSELHLSDEALVGLPKENYKPRPSRYGRGTGSRLPDTDVDKTSSNIDDGSQATLPATDDGTMLPPPPKKSSKKSGRKAKVKRAKTSAVAFKGEPMLSDEDQDVIYMDEQPVKVKMQLPDDPRNKRESSTKEEKEEAEVSKISVDTSGGEDSTHADLNQRSISVEVRIPMDSKSDMNEDPVEVEVSKPPPKKRGRKPKKAVEAAERVEEQEESISIRDDEMNAHTVAASDDDDDDDDDEPVPVKRRGRPPLKEKTTNTSTPLASLEKTSIQQAEIQTNQSEDEQNRNQPSTPSPVKCAAKSSAVKDTTNTPTTGLSTKDSDDTPTTSTSPPKQDPNSSSKGPVTHHSPINPSGPKVKFRVGLSKRARIPSLLTRVKR